MTRLHPLANKKNPQHCWISRLALSCSCALIYSRLSTSQFQTYISEIGEDTGDVISPNELDEYTKKCDAPSGIVVLMLACNISALVTRFPCVKLLPVSIGSRFQFQCGTDIRCMARLYIALESDFPSAIVGCDAGIARPRNGRPLMGENRIPDALTHSVSNMDIAGPTNIPKDTLKCCVTF